MKKNIFTLDHAHLIFYYCAHSFEWRSVDPNVSNFSEPLLLCQCSSAHCRSNSGQCHAIPCHASHINALSFKGVSLPPDIHCAKWKNLICKVNRNDSRLSTECLLWRLRVRVGLVVFHLLCEIGEIAVTKNRAQRRCLSRNYEFYIFVHFSHFFAAFRTFLQSSALFCRLSHIFHLFSVPFCIFALLILLVTFIVWTISSPFCTLSKIPVSGVLSLQSPPRNSAQESHFPSNSAACESPFIVISHFCVRIWFSHN